MQFLVPKETSRAGHGIGCLAMIWAQDAAGVLGAGGNMIWRVPADFKHFQAATLGCPLIMGRTSFDALGRPLPGRRNIVMTRQLGWTHTGVEVADSLDSALACAGNTKLVWVAGGSQVYTQAMDRADVLVLTDLDFRAPVPPGLDPVFAPVVDPKLWELDPKQSDEDWRPASGDGRWRVRTYLRIS